MTSGTLERPRIACQLGSPDRADIAVRERTAAMMDILFNGVGWTDIALTLNRIAVGMFFMLSGYHKLFNPQRHRALADELKELGVPAVGFNQWWVPTVEFTAGGAVVIGFLAPLAALGLLVITIVAIATSGTAANQSLQADRSSRPDRRLALSARDPLCLHVDHGRLGRRRAVQP
jgi:uncharacterized membrane protein YphA (DoxX/SURF4 family)